MSAKVAQCKMDGQAGILELRNGAELCILYMPWKLSSTKCHLTEFCTLQRPLQGEGHSTGTKPGLANDFAVGSVVDVSAVRRVPVSLEHCLQLLLDCGACGLSWSLVHH